MKLISAALLVVISFPGDIVAQAVDSDAIDAIVLDALKFWHVPGVAVGIVRLGDRRDDQVVYLKGHGVKEIGKPDRVAPDTIFPLASCTKSFTTTAMACLALARWVHGVQVSDTALTEFSTVPTPLMTARTTVSTNGRCGWRPRFRARAC